MGIVRGLSLIVASGATFAIGGGGIGYTLGRIAPSYYRGVFLGGDSPGFSPTQVGLGLGVSQGLIAGLAVGSVVWLGAALFSAPPSPEWRRRDVEKPGCSPAVGWLVAAFTLLPAGVVIGMLWGGLSRMLGRFSEEKAIIAPELARDPMLSGVKIQLYTGDGTAYLSGEVATEEDRDRLRSRMAKLMGESRIDEMIRAVSVRKNGPLNRMAPVPPQ